MTQPCRHIVIYKVKYIHYTQLHTNTNTINTSCSCLQTNMGDNQSMTLVKNKDNTNQEEKPTFPNPFISLLTNFTKFFNFPPPPKSPASSPDAKVAEPEAKNTNSKAPVVVAFPNKQTVAPLKLEAEDLEKDTNPVVLWQVYAIGGFFVLKWAWARWNERRAKKKTNDEDPPPADE